jgi:hypothetical protein
VMGAVLIAVGMFFLLVGHQQQRSAKGPPLASTNKSLAETSKPRGRANATKGYRPYDVGKRRKSLQRFSACRAKEAV